MTKASGKIAWVDLTVTNADAVRDFYAQVVGWEPKPVNTGDYDDYAMHPPDAEAVAGVCHKQGINASVPSGWIVYFTVADLDASVAACEANGGKVLTVVGSGDDRYIFIEDPSGAVCALAQADADGD